jgi:pyruvate kinase
MRGYQDASGSFIPIPELLSAPSATKIVCTLGSSSSSSERLEEMIAAGMDVARLDFSQGDQASQEALFKSVRRLSRKWNNQIAIMCDIAGPKIRLGKVKAPFYLNKGDTIGCTPTQVIGSKSRIQICHQNLLQELKKDDLIYIDQVKLVVVHLDLNVNELVCICEEPGNISSEQCCNIPSDELRVNVMTAKDKENLEFIARLGPEYVTAPFVGRGEDVKKVRDCLSENGNSDIKVIAKIERLAALGENLGSIILEADAIMVTRGDLSTEIESWDAEAWQKLVKRCNRENKPVIMAVSPTSVHRKHTYQTSV